MPLFSWGWWQGPRFCVFLYPPTSAKSGIWQRLDISWKDVCATSAHIRFCIFSFLFLYWQLFPWLKERMESTFLVFGSVPELCCTHRSCTVSSHHHHHLLGKETPLAWERDEETEARTKVIENERSVKPGPKRGLSEMGNRVVSPENFPAGNRHTRQ